MLSYVAVGTNNLNKAAGFFDELFKEFGATRVMEFPDRVISWGVGAPAVAAIVPFDGNPATIGNGNMVTLGGKDRAQVDAVYAKALELGGTDEGAPGDRGGGFYGAYFRDLDGNKFCVFHYGA